MAEATDAQKATEEYRLGYADGEARSQPNRWRAVIKVFGGLVVLLVVAMCLGIPQKLYTIHENYQLKREKARACATAPVVIDCIRAVDAE